MLSLRRLLRPSLLLGRCAALALLIGALPQAQAPANDECAGAFVAIDGVNPFSTINATNSLVPPACSSMTKDVWYSYVATSTGALTVTNCPASAAGASTVPAGWDSVIAIYSGACGTLTQISCADGLGACGVNESLAMAPVTAGTTYSIRVGSFSTVGTATGNFVVSVAGPSANDVCTGATTIAATPFTAPAGSVGGVAATDDADVTCNAGAATVTKNGVWFTYTAPANGIASLSETSANDTVTAIFTGGCGGLTQVACSDPDAFTFAMTGGTQYWILIGMFSATVSPVVNYGFTFDFAVPPANDTCAAAIALALDTPQAGTTAAATNDYQLSGAGAFIGIGNTTSTAPGRDVAYSFTAPAAGLYSIRVTGYSTSQNPVLYDASTCVAGAPPVTVATALLAANRGTTNGAEELMCQSLTAGQTVFVYVDDHVTGNAGSAFVIEVNSCTREVEPNATPATANAYVFGMEGSITPTNEADFFSLGTPAAGSRVFAMADGIAGSSNDFDLRVTTSTDTLEYDDAGNDIPFGSLAPNCSGTPLTGAAAFLRQSHFSTTTQSEPYRLYAVVQPPIGSASLEAEPNDTQPTASSGGNNYFSGALSTGTDVDMYSFNAAAGQLIYIGLDGDPLRNNTPINPALALLNSVGGVLVTVNDGGSTSSTTSGAGVLTATSPTSPGEGLTFRVLTAGTYTARVTGTAGDYLLSVAKLPPLAYCTAGSVACTVGVDEYIADVALGTISNPSPSGAGCYSDFTGLSTDLLKLTGGTLTVTNGTPFAGDQCTVWADWNQNGSLADPGEETVLTGGPAVFSGTIAPPAGAALGATRLRVRLENAGLPSPCGITSVGEVEDYTVNVTVPAAAPGNDNCASAFAIGIGTFGGTTVAATNDGAASCDPGGVASRDVWYSLTAATTGTLTVNTCGSAIDTAVALFSTCGGAELACNDNCSGTPCGGSASCLSLPVTSGQSVRIRVSDKGIGSGGTFSLTTLVVLPGDVCTDAVPIAVPSSTIGDITTATVEVGLPTCAGPGPLSISGGSFVVSGRGLWYKVNLPVSQTVTAHTLIDPGFDSRLSVYTGPCGSLSCITVNDDIATPSFRSKVAFQANAGQDYYILVSGFSSTTVGPFVLTVTGDATPANDLCAAATAIGPVNGSIGGTTAGATGDPSNLTAAGLASCANNATVPVFDVWYSYLAPCNGTLAVNTCGGYDTLLTAYALCPTPSTSNQLVPTTSSCSDNGVSPCGPGSSISIAVVQGTTYLLRVAGGVGAAPGGGFTLTWALPDADGDGVADACDGCPNDPAKVAPGDCGCGVPETDSDGDGTPDCIDACPLDPAKIAPGACGCGVSDLDTDGDGTPDCIDGCPNDPAKIAPGDCGCGVPDTDTDGDGTADCIDACPNDPGKIAPGDCGCGVPDTDTDGDGTPDCFDDCPNDPNKVAPGVCGCGVSDADTDGDGTPDCFDLCPNDPTKIAPGLCGCGVPDLDTDGDGTPDCLDDCPNDPLKVDPGECGCGIPESACQTLSADISALSVTAGGTQNFTLNAGLFHVGDLYLLLGSLSGTSPGTPVGGGGVIPLNFDAYMNFTLQHPNTPPLVNTLGTIPPLGVGSAALTLPPGLAVSLVGLTVNHAYVIIETSPFVAVGDISNPTSLALNP